MMFINLFHAFRESLKKTLIFVGAVCTRKFTHKNVIKHKNLCFYACSPSEKLKC